MGLLGNQNAKGHKPNRTSFKKGLIPWNKGIEYQQIKGEKHHHWMGDEADYTSKHHWVRNNFKKPSECENCGTDNMLGRYGNWHNISGDYYRIRNDWTFLCAKCHRRLHRTLVKGHYAKNLHPGILQRIQKRPSLCSQ